MEIINTKEELEKKIQELKTEINILLNSTDIKDIQMKCNDEKIQSLNRLNQLNNDKISVLEDLIEALSTHIEKSSSIDGTKLQLKNSINKKINIRCKQLEEINMKIENIEKLI